MSSILERCLANIVAQGIYDRARFGIAPDSLIAAHPEQNVLLPRWSVYPAYLNKALNVPPVKVFLEGKYIVKTHPKEVVIKQSPVTIFSLTSHIHVEYRPESERMALVGALDNPEIFIWVMRMVSGLPEAHRIHVLINPDAFK